jgi:hypothetical protein
LRRNYRPVHEWPSQACFFRSDHPRQRSLNQMKAKL